MSGELFLVALGLVGSGSLAWLAFAMGFNKDLTFTNGDEIAKHLADFAPDAVSVAATPDASGKMALVRCADDRLYLLVSMGDKVSVRSLSRSQIIHQADGSLRLDFGDFGVPGLDFRADQAKLDAIVGTEREGKSV